MSDEIKSLLDEQGKAVAALRSVVDAKEAEVAKLGKSSGETETKLSKINADLDGVKASMDKLAAAINRKGSDNADPRDGVKAEHKKAFGSFMRKGRDAGLQEIEAKALSIGVAADGGFALPEDIDRNITALLVNLSPMRSLCDVVQVGTTDYKKLVNQRGTASGWVGETAARPATNTPTLAEVPAFMGEIYANPQATQTMLDDVFFNAEAWLGGEVATQFAVAEGTAFLSGSGTNQPKGVTAYTFATTADGVRAFGQLQKIKTGVAGDFAAANKADKIIDLIQSLKAGHRQGASFMTNKALIGEIRQVKDGQGQYLWQPSVQAGVASTLLGYAVHENEDVAAKAVSSLSLLFGNWKAGYCIVDRMGVRTLRDAFTNKPYVGFYTTKRVGGMVVDSEAIKALAFEV